MVHLSCVMFTVFALIVACVLARRFKQVRVCARANECYLHSAQHYEYAWQRAVNEYAKTADDAKNVNEVQLRFECCAFNPALCWWESVCVGRGGGPRVMETVTLCMCPKIQISYQQPG